MAFQLTLLPPYCWRCYSITCNITLLLSLPHTVKMPRKIRRTKGRAKTEERYQFNKELNRPRKYHNLITTKILATDHYLKQGRTALEVENEFRIPRSSIRRIARQARQRAKEHRRPLEDISNY